MSDRLRWPAGVTVAAVLLPGEEHSVQAAGSGCFTLVPQESVAGVLRVLRERPVDAVLLSVHRIATEPVGHLQRLVHGFPGIPTVALVSRPEPGVAGALLRLGATGVRDVVDVSNPAGWTRLRQVVARPEGRTAARILGPLLDTLPDLTEDGRFLLETMVRRAPGMPVVRHLARDLGVRPSTLMSRFHRAGLPSPKNYLAGMRLLHAAQLFEAEGLSIADVAYRLEYSSPQSMGRHLRAMLGITCTEFRRRFPFLVALDRFLQVLATPHQGAWAHFHPLAPQQSRQRTLPDRV